jgi:hypothetical protein
MAVRKRKKKPKWKRRVKNIIDPDYWDDVANEELYDLTEDQLKRVKCVVEREMERHKNRYID